MKHAVHAALLLTAIVVTGTSLANEAANAPMQGCRPAVPRRSRWRITGYPMSLWAFRNAGAVLNTVVVPAEGDIRRCPDHCARNRRVAVPGRQGGKIGFDALFETITPMACW